MYSYLDEGAIGLLYNSRTSAVAVTGAAAVVARGAHHVVRHDAVQFLAYAVVQDLNLNNSH
jgi:hypothetical protein